MEAEKKEGKGGGGGGGWGGGGGGGEGIAVNPTNRRVVCFVGELYASPVFYCACFFLDVCSLFLEHHASFRWV